MRRLKINAAKRGHERLIQYLYATLLIIQSFNYFPAPQPIFQRLTLRVLNKAMFSKSFITLSDESIRSSTKKKNEQSLGQCHNVDRCGRLFRAKNQLAVLKN
jgi:hypothetical protein